MFDPVTDALIRRAPGPQGFADALPNLLSEAYVLLATLRLRGAGSDDQAATPIEAALLRLREVAMSLGLYACLAQDSEERRASAFVAATSHHLIFQHDLLVEAGRARRSLTAGAVSSDICAALMFLAAGYPADAAETVAYEPVVDEGDYRRPLSRSIADFARGRLPEIVGSTFAIPGELDDEDLAEAMLWQRVHTVLSRWAATLLGLDGAVTASQALAELADIMDASVLEISSTGTVPSVISAFSGPHHLASLLSAAIHGLDGNGVVDVPAPAGPDPGRWRSFVRSRAAEKPYVWTNHMAAVSQGLLDLGKSGVISFPTGAGKSTLCELKIAATVMSGKRVVYLVPTLALVAQVADCIKQLLDTARVGGSAEADVHEDGLFAELEAALDADVSVLTPERCLLLIGLYPERFSDTGLVVFDECHLVHPQASGEDRRNIDAMLCLMKVLDLAREADVLLVSAMMNNAEEIARWLQECFGRRALAFDGAWKPTRQARASLVFNQAELDRQRDFAVTQKSETGRYPQSKLHAAASMIVGLKQTWASPDGKDYRLLDLSSEDLKLRFSTGRQPRLQLDNVAASVSLATQAAEVGLKTIVFFHNPSSVTPSVEAVARRALVEYVPDDFESSLATAAARELGGDEFVLCPRGVAGGHFGDLILQERRLVEAAFKRQDGIRVLFSTNTLAQGMNLPADQVIIVRTGNYSQTAEEYRPIAVHELLNAAGRAGRAGHAAYGFVLVIPDELVGYRGRSLNGPTIRDLRNDVLAQDDRCLRIDDPLSRLLAACELAPGIDDVLVDSLLIRLPASENDDAPARAMLNASLGAHRMRLAGKEQELALRIEAAIERRRRILSDADGGQAQTMLCAATGLRPAAVDALMSRLTTTEFADLGVLGWFDWVAAWLDEDVASARLLGVETNESELRYSDPRSREAFTSWISGRPLVEIERVLMGPDAKLKHLPKARRFVKGTVRNVSRAIGIVAQLAGALDPVEHSHKQVTAAWAALMAREGFERPDHLLLYHFLRSGEWTRVRIHEEAAWWLRHVPPATASESYEEAARRVKPGILQAQRESDAARKSADR